MKRQKECNTTKSKIENNSFQDLSLLKVFLLSTCILFSSNVFAQSLNSLSGLEQVLKHYNNSSRKVASGSQQGYRRMDAVYRYTESNEPTIINDAGDVISGPGKKKNCNSLRSGGVYGDVRKHKVSIMGDGKPFDSSGNMSIEDDRQLCQAEDTTCNASGSFWCEDRQGDLVLAASGTVVDGEMIYNPETRDFEYKKWNQDKVKFIAAGHNFTDNRKKYSNESIPIGGTCYFYPKGNEPMKFESTDSHQYTINKKNFRHNEDQLRAKVLSTYSNWTTNGNIEKDWMVGTLDKNITKSKAPIINIPRDLLQLLADRGADIKQYGYNTNYGTLNVAKKNTQLFASYNPSFLNRNFKNIVLDCNDTNGGSSGGPSTISVYTNSGKRIEAVYAIRRGWLSNDGKERSPGEVCDPTKFANSARLVSGDFYKAISD